MMNYALILLLSTALLPGISRAQSNADEAAVRRAVLDYVEGFYEGDAEKIRRSVSDDVSKRGFWRRRGAENSAYQMEPMSFVQILDYVSEVEKSGHHESADAVKEVQIFEILDQTASAKLTASWGIDYILLGRGEGDWKVMQVLWQTPPPREY